MLRCFSPASRIILIERRRVTTGYDGWEGCFSPASRIILIEREKVMTSFSTLTQSRFSPASRIILIESWPDIRGL